MAQTILGCQHYALPQPIVRKPSTRQQWALASSRSLGQSGCSKQTLARGTNNSCASQIQRTARAETTARQTLVRCAQSQSGGFDNSFQASSHAPDKHLQVSEQQVPWGLKELFSVTLLWLLGFWFLGYFILPGMMDVVGLDKDDLSITYQALYHVVFDLCQLGFTVRILLQRLKAFRPLQLGWFKARLFPLKQWLLPVALATAMFPLLNWAAHLSQAWFPDDLWTQNLEQSIVRGDSTSNVLYFAVLIFCAPIWEEVMFRGFVLPSLNKYMPKPIALLLTSAVFAILHFSVQRFIPLVLLGVVLGFVYMRTRNLVAPIAVHSLWNVFIFYNLLKHGSGSLG